MMKQLAKLKFKSFGLQLPVDWKQPSGDPDGKHYQKAFKPEELAGVPVPDLFLSQSTNKYHCDTASTISKEFAEYIDGISDAICSAWSQWQSAATLIGVVVNAVTAAGGQVVGPPWDPLIMAGAPKDTPQKLKYSTAIATAIGAGWLSYTATIKVPGMPWYPAFAAFPAPVAPPTPNIPCPVAALTQVDASISASALKGSMVGLLGDPKALHHDELFASIADAFEKCFMIWKASTQVTNVLGAGPIPTFAPPYVPVGPVVGGVGVMTPGGFF
jgi:hypothetical protein